jgi:hypothetical protein
MAAANTVRVVAGEPGGAAAARVVAELARAGHAAVAVGPELESADGIFLLLDDSGLADALAQLVQLAPGRATFPNVVLVAEQPEQVGGLLAEGFRDIVRPADAPRAVDAVLRGKPPVLLTAVRAEIEGEFLPKFVAELRQRAKEKQTLIDDCIDLVRAKSHLEERVNRLLRMYGKQAIDELLIQDGQIDAYLATLDERKRPRLNRLPTFPSASPLGGVLGKREPRYRKAAEEIEDAVDWLRHMGLLRALGQSGQEAVAAAATELKRKPLQGLRECVNIVEREIALRLSLIDRIQTQVNPIAVLEERCLERYGLGVLPPGIAVPESVHVILRSFVQPPAEIYVTWCLDLRDLRLKPCADVLADIARDLAWTREEKTRPQTGEAR